MTVWAEKSKVVKTVVEWVPVFMVQFENKFLIVPER